MIDYKLGLSEKTWTYIGAASAGLLLLTASKNVANEIGKEGIFGYGKSKKARILWEEQGGDLGESAKHLTGVGGIDFIGKQLRRA